MAKWCPSDRQCSLETLWVVINNRLQATTLVTIHYHCQPSRSSIHHQRSPLLLVSCEVSKKCVVWWRHAMATKQCSINLVNLGNKCFHRHCWDCAIQCIFPTMKMARRAIMLLRLPAFAFQQLLRDLLTRSLNYFYSKPLHSHLESAIDPPTSWQQISASVTFICKSHGDFSFLQKKKPFTGTCFKSFE